MPRGSARPHPASTLTEAAVIANAIRDHNAGKPMNRILLAQAVDHSPASSAFRELITSANKYGLIEGNYNSELISLTELGEQYTQPSTEEERLEAARDAILSVSIFGQILNHYDNNKLPPVDVLKGILERAPFSIAAEWSQEIAELFTKNGWTVGFVRDVRNSPWVIRQAGPPTRPGVAVGAGRDIAETAAPDEVAPTTQAETQVATEPSSGAPSVSEPPVTPPAQRQFFVAFGRDREALAQLQTILKELNIPYLVAEEEPHAGRPIPEKVADLMKSCSAGVFIFSADEHFQDKDGNAVVRPRENVVYELGAASLLYGRRIVVFKEEGVSFPSDFGDLGYIEYKKGSLAAKSMEFLRELVALKAVRIEAGY